MIEDYQFGEIVVEGKGYRKDLKIINKKVYPNWWRKEGHLLQPEDLEDVWEAKPEVLVVGTGAYGVMKVDERTKKRAEELGIKLEAYPTKEAVERFNKLIRKGKKVAGAFHLTC